MHIYIYILLPVMLYLLSGLSCSAVSSTSQVSVAATQNWLYKSFAKFEQTDKAMTLEGPEIAECVATGVNTRWDVPRPATVSEYCNTRLVINNKL